MHAALAGKGFNGARSGDSITMKTKTLKCNYAQISFSNTLYEIDLIIIAKYVFVDSTVLAFVKYGTNRDPY